MKKEKKEFFLGNEFIGFATKKEFEKAVLKVVSSIPEFLATKSNVKWKVLREKYPKKTRKFLRTWMRENMTGVFAGNLF